MSAAAKCGYSSKKSTAPEKHRRSDRRLWLPFPRFNFSSDLPPKDAFKVEHNRELG